MKKSINTIFFIYISIVISLLVVVILFNLNQNIFKFFLKNYDEKKIETPVFLIRDTSMIIYNENYTSANFTMIPLVDNIHLNKWIIEFADAYNLKATYCKVLVFTENPYETQYVKIYIRIPPSPTESSNQKLTFSYIPVGEPAEVVVILNKTCTAFLYRFLQDQNTIRIRIGVNGIFADTVLRCTKDKYTNLIVCLEG